MAGLLGDVLPYIYQRANALKRGLGDFVSDPVGSITQGVNYANDRAGGLLEATRAASEESAAGGGLMYGPANKKLAGILANAYNPMGITVYHGSPHKFTKFDSSKIGTGEGAQAYGHGLYLAESPSVAKTYADTLGEEVLVKGEHVYKAHNNTLAGDSPIGNGARTALQGANWDLAKAQEAMKDAFQASKDQYFKRAFDELSALVPGDITRKSGSLYKVDLPDSAVARMLDWDKPLSQQAPEVQSVLSMLADAAPMPKKNIGVRNRNAVKSLSEAMNGGDAYFNLGGYNNAGPTSQMLRQAGIPGIRYLDGGSRGLGGGTSNFVIFPGEESLLTILERNGMPLPK